MKRFIVIMLCLLLPLSAYSNNSSTDDNSFDLSIYLSQKNSLTHELNELSGGNLSGGIGVDYLLPIDLNLGINSSFEFGGSYIASERIQNWNILNGSVGIFYDLPFSDYFILSPMVSYGAMLNFVKYENKNAFFIDQLVKISLGFKITSDEAMEKGISIFATPFYSFSPEKTTLVQYFGFNAGISYRFH